jgi:acetyl-CoA acetyltransferase
MEEYGVTAEDFAQVSVKNHHHGCLNPMAQYQKEFTVEEVLDSRMICDPITLLQCCPNTDGAAGVVLCSIDVARQHTTQPVKIIGSALLAGDYAFRQTDLTILPFGAQTANHPYEMAGVGPEDLDVAELHDAFAPEEILRYEDLNLCERGAGVELLRSGATALGGKVPVNPSGGLLSLGHPLSASGVRVMAEITLHLGGQAGKRQVPDARVGLAHMLGRLGDRPGGRRLRHPHPGATCGCHLARWPAVCTTATIPGRRVSSPVAATIRFRTVSHAARASLPTTARTTPAPSPRCTSGSPATKGPPWWPASCARSEPTRR